MRRLGNLFLVVLATLFLTTLARHFIPALLSYLSGNSHSLKFIYTVATEIFENYHYECRLACLIVAD